MEDFITPKIEIDTQSEIFIRRAAKQYTIIGVLFVLLSFAGLVIQLLRLRKYGFRDYADWYSIFNYSMLPLIFIGYLLLSSFQIYYYFKAIRTQNFALYSMDQELFGKSFQYYVWGNRMSLICMGLYFFIDLIVIYQEVNVKA